MSAILSAEALNDFIAPSVACIKPVETLPPPPSGPPGEVSVLRDGEGPAADTRTTAQISLTDCLACSGCVTSSEAVLVQMQSHTEVLSALEQFPARRFVALVSPQTRAALAAALGAGTSEAEVGNMIAHLLAGLGFRGVVDTGAFRRIALDYAAREALARTTETPKLPILASSCPGFICYLESTHPDLIPHLSAAKSPQAIGGTFVKALLIAEGAVQTPEDVYVVSIMPCFDKKLEGARGELTSAVWAPDAIPEPARDVDCVITTRELLSLCDIKGVSFPALPRTPPEPSADTALSKNATIAAFLATTTPNGPAAAGTSGGSLAHILTALLATHPDASVRLQPGRNIDTLDYILTPAAAGAAPIKLSRCYGFRNIQNLVRRLKPARPKRVLPSFGKAPAASAVTRAPARVAANKADTAAAYVEVMACPGGCTNGGGQIKWDDAAVWTDLGLVPAPASQKALLARVDEAYFSDAEEEGLELQRPGAEVVEKVEREREAVQEVVRVWEGITGVEEGKLVRTGYRRVENDIGGRLDDTQALQVASGATGGW
ncbi:iron-sulfur cluster assembly associated protein Nar1 [Geopyxis carbonaria]|nr:iron-sulfur cluster assembly associated protein Nar1 [Geopyxis carbonaria]